MFFCFICLSMIEHLPNYIILDDEQLQEKPEEEELFATSKSVKDDFKNYIDLESGGTCI